MISDILYINFAKINAIKSDINNSIKITFDEFHGVKTYQTLS